jgi:HSP20 family protein
MANLMTRDSSTGSIEQRAPAPRRGIFDIFFQAPLAETTLPELSLARAMMSAIAGPTTEMMNFVPNVEVAEKDGNYVVDVALPGFRRDDIDIEVSGNELTVSGKYERKQEDGKKHYSEMRQASFTRTLVLPQEINADQVTAAFDNGILHITARPLSQIASKKVQIK